MIQVTFAYLIPDQPHQGTGFYLDREYAGYIGQDTNGAHFVYFYRPFWHHTRIREARGYVFSGPSRYEAFCLLRRVVRRLSYRRLMSRARSALRVDCQSVWHRRILEDQHLQYVHSNPYFRFETWFDPAEGNRQLAEKSDFASTPGCASQKDDAPVSLVRRVHRCTTFNLITYFDGTTRRVTAADIQAGAAPAPADTAFPFVRAACPVAPVPQASPRALFLPMTAPSLLLAGHHPAAPTTTMRNTQ